MRAWLSVVGSMGALCLSALRTTSRNTLSIRDRLYAVMMLGILSLALLGSVAIFTARQGVRALDRVYHDSVVSLALLQELHSNFKDVRFRMAGVVLGHLPFVGSANHLKDVKKELPRLWEEFRTQPLSSDLSEEAQEARARLEAGMTLVAPLLEKLEQAYAGDEKNPIALLLEDEWPAIHSEVIKPIEKLMPLYRLIVLRTYETQRQMNGWLLVGVVVLFLLASGSFGLITLGIVRQIHLKLLRANQEVEAVAQLDLSRSFDTDEHDEISQQDLRFGP